MKIVQALGWYFPESLGGTETYVAALSRNLRALGHEVVVTAPQSGETHRTYEHEGSEVFRYPIPRRPTRAECQGDTLVRGASNLHDWLCKEAPDVFHCHSLVTGLGMREIGAAKDVGARVVLRSHSGPATLSTGNDDALGKSSVTGSRRPRMRFRPAASRSSPSPGAVGRLLLYPSQCRIDASRAGAGCPHREERRA
jgi:glycosyltransferase involved in cell wall biosynthesis